MPDSTDPFDFGRYHPAPVPRPPEPDPAPGTTAWSGPRRPAAGFEGQPGAGFEGQAGDVVVGRAPVVWIAAAAVSAVAGAVLSVVLRESLTFALLGWLLAGPVAIGLLAVFTARDTEQRSKSVHLAPSWVSRAYWGTVGLALVGLVIAAWQVADLVARR